MALQEDQPGDIPFGSSGALSPDAPAGASEKAVSSAEKNLFGDQAPPAETSGGSGIKGKAKAAGAAGAGAAAKAAISSAPKALEVAGGAGVAAALWEWITTPAHWLRILEYAAGALLLYMGIRGLAGIDAPDPLSVARKVIK